MVGTDVHKQCPVSLFMLQTLTAFGVKFGAMVAQRFSAGSASQILAFDIVAFRAASVVVMDILLDRMPGTLSRHASFSLLLG